VSSSMEAREFIELGKNAKDPAKQFGTYQKKYDSNTMTADEMVEYVTMCRSTCLSVKEVMAKYFATQKESELTNERNWNMITGNLRDISQDSREFNYLTSHRDDYAKIYSAGRVDSVIMGAYSMALYNHIKDKNYDAYFKLREQVAKSSVLPVHESLLSLDLVLYKSKKEWTNYARVAVEYVEKYKMDNDNTLNNIAWDFYEYVEDKVLLAKAAEWSKRSVELNPEYYNYDTYAAVLFKLGKKSEAKAAAEKAIEFGKKSGEDVKSTEELLDKINALK
jgi:hypothetical protein